MWHDCSAQQLKNGLPAPLLTGIVTHAQTLNNDSTKNVVINLFSGWQSWRPVCQELGLKYIAVHIEGDRNAALIGAIAASMGRQVKLLSKAGLVEGGHVRSVFSLP